MSPPAELDEKCHTRIGKYDVGISGPDMTAEEFFALSVRELEVLNCLVEGMTGPEIAAKMNVTINTVNTYKERITKKLGVDRLALAVTLLVAYYSGAEVVPF